jgi:hypothetical protein
MLAALLRYLRCVGSLRNNLKKGDRDMLGDKIGSIQSATAIKTLPAEDSRPVFEVSAQGAGKLGDTDVQIMATYSANVLADGSLYGECPNAGVVMAQDGIGTFRASGAGAFTADGGSTFRGVVYFQSAAPSLAGLNGKAVVYHWDVDADGNAAWDLWEWN